MARYTGRQSDPQLLHRPVVVKTVRIFREFRKIQRRYSHCKYRSVLQQADGQALRQTLPPGQDTIRISTAEALGNYRLVAGGKSRTLDLGFSVNGTAACMAIAGGLLLAVAPSGRPQPRWRRALLLVLRGLTLLLRVLVMLRPTRELTDTRLCPDRWCC